MFTVRAVSRSFQLILLPTFLAIPACRPRTSQPLFCYLSFPIFPSLSLFYTHNLSLPLLLPLLSSHSFSLSLFLSLFFSPTISLSLSLSHSLTLFSTLSFPFLSPFPFLGLGSISYSSAGIPHRSHKPCHSYGPKNSALQSFQYVLFLSDVYEVCCTNST